jgi:DNA-binding response OmpR family regulator
MENDMAASPSPLIAVLDHDAILLRLMNALFKTEGFRTLLLPDSASAYDLIKDNQPDVLMLDTWVEDSESGWRLLQTLLMDEETKHIPIMICSSDPLAVQERHARVARHRRIEVLPKPYDTETLMAKVRELLAPEAPTRQALPGEGEATAEA